MPTVDDTPVEIGVSGYLIQNLGPDNLYVGDSDVTTETGIELTEGQSITVGYTNTGVFAVSDGTSDVRVLERGAGIFSPTAAPA